MLGTKRLTDEELIKLLRRLQRVNFGRWSQNDVTRAISALGWQLQHGEVDVGMWRAETGYETGAAIIDRIPTQAGIKSSADFYAVELMLLRSAVRGQQGENHRTIVFREVLRTMLKEFGKPDVRGGDGGPWVRWRDSVLTVELHLRRFHGGVSLRLLATDALEKVEAYSITRGDVSGWTAYTKLPELPSEPAVNDLGEFTARLSGVLGDIAGDVPIVDTAGTVILRTSDWSARYVLATVHGGIDIEASAAVKGSYRTGMGYLAGLGFRKPNGGANPNWTRRFGDGDRDSTHTAAHMMVDALRAFGIEDLYDIVYDAFTADGERMYLPVLGIASADSMG
ncbi:TY-Chap domain-containing protein [Stackebrandtia soli]|uniref:TY-Chap domain-containing protein n=1 Tax=Stackebrandtia soli TaxID=1892856 RepID=UPI0039EACBB6